MSLLRKQKLPQHLRTPWHRESARESASSAHSCTLVQGSQHPEHVSTVKTHMLSGLPVPVGEPLYKRGAPQNCTGQMRGSAAVTNPCSLTGDEAGTKSCSPTRNPTEPEPGPSSPVVLSQCHLGSAHSALRSDCSEVFILISKP